MAQSVEGFNIKIGADTSKLANALSKVGGDVEKLGKTLTTSLTIPIAAAVSYAVKAASDFETAFTGVTKTVSGTKKELEDLRQGMIDLSTEIPSSADEIANIGEVAGQLGIATDDILEFSKVMINLGVSTNLGAEEAASSLAKFANVTKMNSADYERLGSTIVDLGNNFATTEKDIVEMGTRMAATGDIVGLTQPQIMAVATALSSVGVEAEAGGSAMSKLLKKMQLAVETGNGLNAYAKVAGQTTKEFSELFKQDAAEALNEFIKGLGQIEKSGGSAISVLDDMNLNEVRLSNTILALANSEDILGKTLDTANKAWKENSALTNEANKFYDTFANQLKLLKNNITKIAIEFGEVLLPHLKNLVNKFSEFSEKLQGMSKEEKEQILRIAGLVAAIGPLLTTIGKFMETAKSTISVIKNLNSVLSLSKEATGLLGGAIKLLTNPYVALGSAILGTVAAVVKYENKATEEANSLHGLKDILDEQTISWDKLKESREQNLLSNQSEMNHIKALKDELLELADSTGKVEGKDRDRAEFILGQLNEALDTEYTMTGNQIDNYKQLQQEIGKVIEAKKLEQYLSAYEESYNEAINQEADAVKVYNGYLEKLNALEEERNKIIANKDKYWTSDIYYSQLWKVNEEIEKVTGNVEQSRTQVEEYGKTISVYEGMQAAAISGTAEEMQNALTSARIAFEDISTAAGETTEQQIIKQQEFIDMLKTNAGTVDQYGKEVYEDVITLNEGIKTDLEDTLLQSIDITTDLTPDLKTALYLMAFESKEKYDEVINTLPQTMLDDLQLTSEEVKDYIDLKENMKQQGKDSVEGFGKGWTEQEQSILDKVKATANKILGAMANVLHIGSPSKEMAKLGKFTGEGFEIGLKNSEQGIYEEVSKISNNVLGNFGRNVGSLTNDISRKSKNIFTTPTMVFNCQNLNEEQLDKAFNYVNRRLGSQY